MHVYITICQKRNHACNRGTIPNRGLRPSPAYGPELRGKYVCVHIYTCLNLVDVMEFALRGSESWKCSVTLILLSSTCSLRRITNISSCSGRRGWEAGPALVESLHACIAQRRESAVKIRAVSILIISDHKGIFVFACCVVHSLLQQ